jgi:CDGSH-type Zn-finger protein
VSDGTFKVKLIPNGPIRVQTERTEITMPDGSTVIKEGHFSFCRCGQSENKPFCDGTHKTCGFEG